MEFDGVEIGPVHGVAQAYLDDLVDRFRMFVFGATCPQCDKPLRIAVRVDDPIDSDAAPLVQQLCIQLHERAAHTTEALT